ncbi:MAG: VOC family protein [Tannerellaceae bacterium]|nr:VOC family protein [Tannerellaceae bacterium]
MDTKAKLLVLWMGVAALCPIEAQEAARPPVWGIAKMTFLVSDMDMARAYYGDFLGFDEAFAYPSAGGTVVSFKVNDRQFLEFVTDENAKEKNRLVSVSLETPSAEQMRLYLQSQGVKTPERTTIDGAGNEAFTVSDNDGNPIEFINLKTDGLHRRTKGRYLSANRISKRIHHVGLYSEKIDEQDSFWIKVLKCREMVRYPEDRANPPVLHYLDFGDSTESIEHYSPCDVHFAHPCFLVDDMQETVYTLKERQGSQTLARPSIGKGNRWILNLRTPDMTRVEFTEAHRVR